jgi:V/A-type H+/Na+-transporting ATPase subunit I
MSIVPMQKVRIVVHSSDSDALLQILQRHSALELLEMSEIDDSTSVQKRSQQDVEFYGRLASALTTLEHFSARKSLWRQLRDGTTEVVKESDIDSIAKNRESVEHIIASVEKLQQCLTEVEDNLRLSREKELFFNDWYNTPLPLSDLKTNTTHTIFLQYSTTSQASLAPSSIYDAFAEKGYDVMVSEIEIGKYTLTYYVDSNLPQDILSIATSLGLETVSVPVGHLGTPAHELSVLRDEILALQQKSVGYRSELSAIASTHLSLMRTTFEVLRWEKDRFSSLEKAIATTHATVFEGWLDETSLPKVQVDAAKAQLAYAIENIPLAPDEEPPVEIRNGGIVKPFEAITRLYGMPGYKDLDPTVFLAGFFFLFFGLSLTDVGYGLILMIVSGGSLLLFKLSNQIRLFAKLLLFVGFATTLVGMLFGGYLGIAPENLPAFLRSIQLFDPIANPLPVFYLALSLGVIQVMFGMVLKMYSEARNGRLISGILDHGPWFMMFVLGIVYVLVATSYIANVSIEIVTRLIYGNLAIIVITSARNAEGVVDMIKLSLLSLYNSLGYLSDILSYSRLLALGLATTALAFAVNLIADIVGNAVPYIGPVIAVLILIVGHLFTLAVNTLGAFIHSARLQFVEFFGKFISGTGRNFNPLSRTQHHLTVIDD